MFGDPLLSSLEPGATLDLVAYITQADLHGASLQTLWHSESCRCKGTFSAGGVVTLYGVQYLGTYGNSHHLMQLPGTVVVQRPPLDARSYLSFKEVFAGIGGMTQGVVLLGGHSTAVMDSSPLACDALRAQGTTVITGDISDSAARQSLHMIEAETRSLLGASLPGPGPFRGLCSGSVEGCTHLQSVLCLAWHAQASGLVLEGDPVVMQSPECTKLLREFSVKAGYHQTEVILDLAQQWPMHQVRYWAVLLPAHLPQLHLTAWSEAEKLRIIRDVIPEWPIWPHAIEQALQWTDTEKAAFASPSFGPTDRTLDQNKPAPPAHHSWGNAFRPCPCGCRSEPFTTEALLKTGLRGQGVPSALTQEMRFPHAEEIGLLAGLLPGHPLPGEPRAALCLACQITSPMQALWVFAHLKNWASAVHGGPSCRPQQVLHEYQSRLLNARQDQWITPSILAGGSIMLECPGGHVAVPVNGPTKVGDLLRAYKADLEPGLSLKLLHEGRALSPSAFLHPAPQGPKYSLVISAKRARREVLPEPPAQASQLPAADASSLCRTPSAIRTGQLDWSPAPALPEPCPELEPTREQPLQLPGPACTAPASNATPRGSFTASVAPLTQPTVPGPSAQVPLAQHFAQFGTSGCTDVAIWCGLWELVRSIPGASALILPPKIAGALLELGAADQLRLKHHPALALPEGMLVFVPFVHQEHWTLLVLSISNGSALAEVFDGVPGRNLVQAKQLSTLLCELAGRTLETVTECCTWPQRTQNDCGAILLAHAAGKLSGTNDPAQLQEAQAFIATFPPLPHCLLGRGGLSSEQEQALQKLLVSKGVPSANVAARLQQAVSKLGPGPIAEALHSRNPWQALKSAGSRPGTLFKWVQPDELEMHIEQRAQERFGTEVVFVSQGFRVICGDFNHDLSSLQQCAIWLQGWIEAQVSVIEAFQVSQEAWHQHGDHQPIPPCSSDLWYARFAKAVEQSPHQTADLSRPSSSSAPKQAANPAASALAYRLSLWQSIKTARGFRNGFPAWWSRRLVQLVGSPASLPLSVPAAPLAKLLYEDFRCNFRLEDWHLRRRMQILDAKYDKSLSQIYKDLREPAPEQVDSLQVRRDYAILAVAPSCDQVHLDSPLDRRGFSTWAVDGDPVRISSCDGDLCTLTAPASPTSSVLEQVQTLSSVADLFSEFKSLWAPRWQLHSTTTSYDWDRFLRFASAVLPCHRLVLPEITVEVWTRAVRRFKTRAARGPDGWARLDLLNMPPQRTQELLHFLAAVEA
ncbi:hgiCIIM [Symbiodinium sp. CCMP2456]|nr:hgiCIIM [Symbiodinium sp. CCMP2456]